MIFNNRSKAKLSRLRSLACISLAAMALVACVAAIGNAQGSSRSATLRVGEKLSYSVSFEKFRSVGFVETNVVSQGKLGGKDVVEIRSRARTYDMVSAAFDLLDEDRSVFADPETGLPVFIKSTVNDAVTPKVTESNFLTAPTTSFDLVSLLFRLREAGGTGSFPLTEDGENFVVTALGAKSEKVSTEAGEYDTTLSTLQSAYFDGRDIKGLSINFTADEARIPVLIRFKTQKGVYRIELSSMKYEVPEPPPTVTPTPVTAQTPKPATTPKPVATPTPYINDQPLLSELAFSLGEKLEYAVTSGGKPAALLTLHVKERRLFNNIDSLLLSAKITGIEQGNSTLALGDGITTQVDPDTLAPIQYDAKFGAALAGLNLSAKFDQRTGSINIGSPAGIDAPVGTHTILSLLYAMRSFNLKPSKDLTNPVNDTRVAVFWADRPYVFTLRPGKTETITVGEEVIPVQLVTVITGNQTLDSLAIKVWLSTDGKRVPVRISAGTYQADLKSISSVIAQ